MKVKKLSEDELYNLESRYPIDTYTFLKIRLCFEDFDRIIVLKREDCVKEVNKTEDLPLNVFMYIIAGIDLMHKYSIEKLIDVVEGN